MRPGPTIGAAARRAIGIPYDLEVPRDELPDLAYLQNHLRESVDLKNNFIPDSLESFLAILPRDVRRDIRDRFAVQYHNLIGDLGNIADLKDGQLRSPLLEGLTDEDLRFPAVAQHDPGFWLSGAGCFQRLVLGLSMMRNFGTHEDTVAMLESEAGADFLRVKFIQVLAQHAANVDHRDGTLPPVARNLNEDMTPWQELDLVGYVSGTHRTQNEAWPHYPHPWSFADGSSGGEQSYREVVFPKQIDQATAIASICEEASSALASLCRTFTAFHLQLSLTVLGYRTLVTRLIEALVSLSDRTIRQWNSVLGVLTDAISLNLAGTVQNAVNALFLSKRQKLAILGLDAAFQDFSGGQVGAWRASRERYTSEQEYALALINQRLNSYHAVLSGEGSRSGGALGWDDWTQDEFAGGGRERNILLPTRPEISYGTLAERAASGDYAFVEDDPAERRQAERLIEEHRQARYERFVERFEYWDPYEGIGAEPEPGYRVPDPRTPEGGRLKALPNETPESRWPG